MKASSARALSSSITLAKHAPRETAAPRSIVRGHVCGALVGFSSSGQPIVDYPGNKHGPLPAKTVVPLPGPLELSHSAEVLLVFEREQSDQPVVVGLLGAGSGHAVGVKPEHDAQAEAVVDGRRVVVCARDEIVLRCGQASVTLRRNGRVVIRGTYVETQSAGVNRIRGGAVKIN